MRAKSGDRLLDPDSEGKKSGPCWRPQTTAADYSRQLKFSFGIYSFQSSYGIAGKYNVNYAEGAIPYE